MVRKKIVRRRRKNRNVIEHPTEQRERTQLGPLATAHSSNKNLILSPFAPSKNYWVTFLPLPLVPLIFCSSTQAPNSHTYYSMFLVLPYIHCRNFYVFLPFNHHPCMGEVREGAKRSTPLRGPIYYPINWHETQAKSSTRMVCIYIFSQTKWRMFYYGIISTIIIIILWAICAVSAFAARQTTSTARLSYIFFIFILQTSSSLEQLYFPRSFSRFQ